MLYVIFIGHLKSFFNEHTFERYYGKNMALKTPGKATSAYRTLQRAIIKFCADCGKTLIEAKQMMKETGKTSK